MCPNSVCGGAPAVFPPVVFLPPAFVFTSAFLGGAFFFANFLLGLTLFLASFFLTAFFIGATFLPAVLIDFACFFLVFFLVAIRAVYHRLVIPSASGPLQFDRLGSYLAFAQDPVKSEPVRTHRVFISEPPRQGLHKYYSGFCPAVVGSLSKSTNTVLRTTEIMSIFRRDKTFTQPVNW